MLERPYWQLFSLPSPKKSLAPPSIELNDFTALQKPSHVYTGLPRLVRPMLQPRFDFCSTLSTAAFPVQSVGGLGHAPLGSLHLKWPNLVVVQHFFLESIPPLLQWPHCLPSQPDFEQQKPSAGGGHELLQRSQPFGGHSPSDGNGLGLGFSDSDSVDSDSDSDGSDGFGFGSGFGSGFGGMQLGAWFSALQGAGSGSGPLPWLQFIDAPPSSNLQQESSALMLLQ